MVAYYQHITGFPARIGPWKAVVFFTETLHITCWDRTKKAFSLTDRWPVSCQHGATKAFLFYGDVPVFPAVVVPQKMVISSRDTAAILAGIVPPKCYVVFFFFYWEITSFPARIMPRKIVVFHCDVAVFSSRIVPWQQFFWGVFLCHQNSVFEAKTQHFCNHNQMVFELIPNNTFTTALLKHKVSMYPLHNNANIYSGNWVTRLQNGSLQINGWCHSGDVQYFYSLWRQPINVTIHSTTVCSVFSLRVGEAWCAWHFADWTLNYERKSLITAKQNKLKKIQLTFHQTGFNEK